MGGFGRAEFARLLLEGAPWWGEEKSVWRPQEEAQGVSVGHCTFVAFPAGWYV